VLGVGAAVLSFGAGLGHLAAGPARGRRLRQLRDIEAAARTQLRTEAVH
jgi:hypothetical protein